MAANINLQPEIEQWQSAVYGEEVRAANVAALNKIQGSVNAAIQETNQAALDVQQLASTTQNVVDAAANAVTVATTSAEEAKSWAVGGTDSRAGENTDNSKYYSMQSELSATAAQDAAEMAQAYAGIVIPIFSVDFMTGLLMYATTDDFAFTINALTGNLEYQLTAAP